MENESVSTVSYKRLSFSNDRALTPSVSGTEKDSQCSTQNAHGFSSCSREKLYKLSIGCVREDSVSNKSKSTKFSTVDSNTSTPRLRAATGSVTPRRQAAPSRIFHPGSKRDSVSLCFPNEISMLVFMLYS